ncbi:hypothetical protein ABTI69_22265, partial [Acinetobacter baumannii]
HLTLAFNPSHLEIVNPVVVGSVYARQRRRGDKTGTQVVPVILHGDAAVAREAGGNHTAFGLYADGVLARQPPVVHKAS